MIRRLWRKLFGPRPRAIVGEPIDWCSVCWVDLRSGEVWEVRDHLPNEAEMGGDGGSWMALTFCSEHAPADAIQA